MVTRHLRSSTSLMVKAAQLALAVPQVVAHRLARLAVAGASPSKRDHREFQRMSAEKAVAFAASWNAMSAQTLRANQALGASFLRALWSPQLNRKLTASAVAARLQSAALGVLNKGLAPVHRKALANAKRLARTKLR